MEYSDGVLIKTETSVSPIFDAYAVQTEKLNKSEINPWFRGSPAEMQMNEIPRRKLVHSTGRNKRRTQYGLHLQGVTSGCYV